MSSRKMSWQVKEKKRLKKLKMEVKAINLMQARKLK